MAKLVRRHTSNVEIVGSNPTGSNYFLFLKTVSRQKILGNENSNNGLEE